MLTVSGEKRRDGGNSRYLWVKPFSWTMREPLETQTTVTTKHSRMLWKGVGSSRGSTTVSARGCVGRSCPATGWFGCVVEEIALL